MKNFKFGAVLLTLLTVALVLTSVAPSTGFAQVKPPCVVAAHPGFFGWLGFLFHPKQKPETCRPVAPRSPEPGSPRAPINKENWIPNSASLVTQARQYLDNLAARAALDVAIESDPTWPLRIERDEFVQPLLEDPITMNYVDRIEQRLSVRFLLDEPSGVTEGYTIGEHTARVLAVFSDQSAAVGADFYRRSKTFRT